MAEHGDNSNNDNKEYISREKLQPAKKTNNNKPSLITMKKSSLKKTHTKKINKEKNYETIYTSYKKYKDGNEGMTLDSKPSTPDPPNTS